MEGSGISRRSERELRVVSDEMDRILMGLDDADPLAAERRLARMSERVRGDVEAMRGIAFGMRRAWSSGVPPGTPRRLMKFRVEGGKVVKVSDELIPASRAVGGSPPPAAPAAPAAAAAGCGSEDELCSAFDSARF